MLTEIVTATTFVTILTKFEDGTQKIISLIFYSISMPKKQNFICFGSVILFVRKDFFDLNYASSFCKTEIKPQIAHNNNEQVNNIKCAIIG